MLKKLGSGSFGAVYRAKRLATGREYAMKRIEISDLSNAEQAQAAREAKILAQMQSEFVVQYFDSFVDEEELCIVMEPRQFVAGANGALIVHPNLLRVGIPACSSRHAPRS